MATDNKKNNYLLPNCLSMWIQMCTFANKLLEFDNAVILFMSSKEIYLFEEEYMNLLNERDGKTSK